MHRGTYASLATDLRRDLERFWRNRITLASLGRLWLSNLVSNIPFLSASHQVTSLTGPAVVCGAGPSLDRVIPVISRCRDRLNVVAVDTALRALEAHAIEPDFVVALDGQIANLYDFLGTEPAAIACDLTSHPATRSLSPCTIPTLTRFAPSALLERISAIAPEAIDMPPLGSVGIAAVHIALRLGAGPVFLAGLDFAVQPGTTHARASTPIHRSLLYSSRLQPARDPAVGGRLVRETVHGKSVLTTSVLRGYADALAEEVRARPNIYLVNRLGLSLGIPEMTPGEMEEGVKAAGTRRIRFESATGPTDFEIERFLETEIQLLQDADPADATTLAPVDYMYCLTPDAIVTLTDRIGVDPERIAHDRALQARLSAARSYMLDRWSNALHRTRAAAAG
jgi:hypothetical protein